MRRELMTITSALLVVACMNADRDATSDTTVPDSARLQGMAGASATVAVRDASGRDLGTLTLSDAAGGISVSGRLTGLAPGEHGMHLHMTGRCDAPTFDSAGSHWNPTSRQHGSQNPDGPHLGDLPNVSATADSSAVVQAVTPGGSLRGAMDPLLDADGAALIVHSTGDDYRTDPSGNSGNPIACGVVSGS
jgi:Cu-Zn family superoxide dismutase